MAFYGFSSANHTLQLHIEISGKIAADNQVHLWLQHSHPLVPLLIALGIGQHMTGLLSRETMPTALLSMLPNRSRVHPRQDLAFLTCFLGDTSQLSSGPSARFGLSTNLSDTEIPPHPVPSSAHLFILLIEQETTAHPLLFNMCPAVQGALPMQSHQVNVCEGTELVHGGAMPRSHTAQPDSPPQLLVTALLGAVKH